MRSSHKHVEFQERERRTAGKNHCAHVGCAALGHLVNLLRLISAYMQKQGGMTKGLWVSKLMSAVGHSWLVVELSIVGGGWMSKWTHRGR